EAYIFMPQWTDVIELFDLHDIKYTRLTEPKKIEVETYRYMAPRSLRVRARAVSPLSRPTIPPRPRRWNTLQAVFLST
ncbi:MAG: hypothetical protein II236_05945, partial [Alistipes sp.]|nr:hypothetical protein [Alistipes sp.]